MHLPIFYSALLLTGVNLLLRFAGTSFQVYISGVLGAAGVGLLQLVMSVGSLALIAGIAGIRTATMYLTAEELGSSHRENVSRVLSGCFSYSILCSGAISALLYLFASRIAGSWISHPDTAGALRLFAVFLPVMCLCNVMVGYFTAANRIGTLAAVEVAEQLVSMLLTLFVLTRYGSHNPARACECVIFGSCMASCLTLLCLTILRLREQPQRGPRLPMARRLRETAVPLALADILKSGINTAENLMVPKRLAQHPMIADPLAVFGQISGMVFPVLMFPACILYGLAELLIPELARCAAAGSTGRISHLTRKSLRIALLYGLIFCGLEFLLSEWLCTLLYGSADAGKMLQWYSLLIPMLYCDAVTDAMTKGLGQQKICVRYNILTSAMDVALLYLLLPKFGMTGYFLSFLVTHLLNFALSLRLLLRITGEHIPFYEPAFAVAGMLGAVLGAGFFSRIFSRVCAYLLLLGSLWCLLRVTGREDLRWLRGLVAKK